MVVVHLLLLYMDAATDGKGVDLTKGKATTREWAVAVMGWWYSTSSSSTWSRLQHALTLIDLRNDRLNGDRMRGRELKDL